MVGLAVCCGEEAKLQFKALNLTGHLRWGNLKT